MKNYIATVVIALTVQLAYAPLAGADYLPENSATEAGVNRIDLLTQFLGSSSFAVSRLEIRKFTPTPVIDLTLIAESRKSDRKVRDHAVRCLALYPAAIGSLEEMLLSTRPSDHLFEAVLLAYAQVSGAEGGGAGEVYTAHHRQEVRLTAVTALGRFGGQAGYEKLAELAQHEEDGDILERIQTYIN
jgi:hypothetical protein